MTQPIKQEKWQRLFSEQEESGESVDDSVTVVIGDYNLQLSAIEPTP
jgi:hypothetical protein